MSVVYIVILVLMVIGMVVGWVRSRAGDSWGQSVTAICAVVGLVVALLHVNQKGETPDERLYAKEHAFAQIATQKLARNLAQTHAGAKALIVMPFQYRTDDARRKAYVEGVKRGLGDAVTIVEVLDPPMHDAVKQAYISRLEGDDPQDLPALHEWFTAAYFDKLIELHARGCTIVVSLISLPDDFERMKLWTRRDQPKIAVLFGPIQKMRKRIESGDVVAAVIEHPDPQFTGNRPPDDVDEAFGMRYLLVTPDNVAELAEKYEDLFE